MPFKVVLVIIMVLWKGEKIVKKRGIFFRILVLSILSVIVLAGCQQNPEEGPRKVAQTYFDAVKMGDLEKAFSCYAPEVQQELDMGMDIASGISESASEKLFGFNVDATGIGSSFMGLAAAETYENYEFKATDVNFTDDEGNSLYQRELTKSMPSVMTNFSNDVGFIQDANGSAVVDTKGNIMFTDEEIFERCVEIFGEDSLDSFELLHSSNEDVQLFNGYCKVELDVNTYEGSGYYQGILKPDGSWLLEPEEVESGVELYADWPLAVMVDKEGNERARERARRPYAVSGLPERHRRRHAGGGAARCGRRRGGHAPCAGEPAGRRVRDRRHAREEGGHRLLRFRRAAGCGA